MLSNKSILQLEQVVKNDHVTPITRTRKEIKQEEEATNAMAPVAKDRTSVPNYLVVIIVGLFISLVGVVWKAQDDKIGDLKLSHKEAIADVKREYDKENTRQDALIDKTQTFIQNTREWLKEHGYDFNDDGKIVKRK